MLILKKYFYILQALNEEQSDYDNVYKLSETFKQVLSSFKIAKREMPLTLMKLYDSDIKKSAISDDYRLILEHLKNVIYKN